MPDVVTLGESMASLRAARAIRLGGDFSASIAGAETNVAIGLARLGHVSAWAGAVGADGFGDLVLRTLRAEGVDLSAARRDDSRPTGLIVFDGHVAGRTIVEYFREGSAGSALGVADAHAALELGPRVMHVTGITPALSDTARDAVLAAAEGARAIGARVSFDVNFRERLWSRDLAAKVLAPIAALSDIVIASDDELDLVAASIPAHAEVVVKLGVHGARVDLRGSSWSSPSVPVQAVDTVGAGDAFVAGYLSALLDGEDVPGRLTRGVMVGAFAVATRGDWEGLPTRAELPLLGLAEGAAAR